MVEAHIHWGTGNGPFMTESASEAVETLEPRNKYRFGLGKRVPTRWKLRRGGTWYRVYQERWSINGPYYIITKGQEVRVTITEES